MANTEVGSAYLSIYSQIDKGFTRNIESAMSTAVSGVQKAAGLMATAVGAVATGIGVIGKKSLDAYASYEQLTGGVEKLFGSSSSKLMDYANGAYSTIGMSSNQYMDQATSFAAALINDLGGDTDKAVESVNKAMRAMSDNASIFGTDMADIQNAFNGFAKQNYTMLDNLKLGYGGTKSEMERLIADANEYAQSIGLAGDLSIDSFADVVEAIDLVQQKQGIAGNASVETLKTISGSIGALKAAWENWLTGLADEKANMSKLTGNLLDMVDAVADNVIPRVTEIATKVIEEMPAIISRVAERIPGIAEPILGAAIDAIGKSVTAALRGLGIEVPDGLLSFKTVKDAFDGFVRWIKKVWDGFTSTFDSSGFEGALTNVRHIIEQAVGFVTEHVLPMAPTIGEFLGYAASALGKVLEAITAVIDFVAPYVGEVLEWVGSIAGAIWDFAVKHEDMGASVKAVWDSMKKAIGDAIDGIKDFVEDMKKAVLDKWEALKKGVKQHTDNMVSTAKSQWSKWSSDTAAQVESMRKTVTEKWDALKNGVKDHTSSMVESTKSQWSRWTNDVSTLTESAKQAVMNKWSDIKSGVTGAVESIRSGIVDKFNAAKNSAVNAFETLKSSIVSKVQSAKDTMSNIVDRIKGLFNFSWSLPRPRLPHIEWYWQNIGGLLSIPVFDGISWYAQGAAFKPNMPHLFGMGVGDARETEYLQPESKLKAAIAEAVSDGMDGRDQQGDISILVQVSSDVLRGAQDAYVLGQQIGEGVRSRLKQQGVTAYA